MQYSVAELSNWLDKSPIWLLVIWSTPPHVSNEWDDDCHHNKDDQYNKYNHRNENDQYNKDDQHNKYNHCNENYQHNKDDQHNDHHNEDDQQCCLKI